MAQSHQIAPEKLDKFYARHAKQFEDIPMNFNILSKRVISFCIGNDMHWLSYIAFHTGELFCETISHTRSSKNRPASFITYIDPMGPGKEAPDAKFVVFLLEIKSGLL
jgi:hypothetical protein